MPLSPPENRNAFALAVLFIIAVITVADIIAITTLGSNANSTFQFVGSTPRARPEPDARQVEIAPPPRPVAPPKLREYTLPLDPNSAVSGFLVPGSVVDVIAALRSGERTRVFRAVENVRVVAANTDDASRASVTLAVTDEQARVLDRAAFRECKLTPKLRPEGRPAEPANDIDTVLNFLALPVAPAPRPAGERSE